MSTPRQLRSLPSMRGETPAVHLGRARRRGRRRVVLAGLLLVAAAGGVLAAEEAAPTAAELGTQRQQAATGAVASEPPADAPVRQTPPDEVPVVAFARIDELVLSLPSPEILLVGYHEASLEGALELQPVGRLVDNANTTRFTAPPSDPDGTPYHVMSSRGRVLAATSAVDLVMPDDTPVLSPVDGVVTEVRPYHLYGTHPDTRIEIRPDDAPHLRVVLIHVDDVQVRRGDRVTTGQSVLAGTANRFSFASHVDRYLDQRWPHVHLEVKDPKAADGR